MGAVLGICSAAQVSSLSIIFAALEMHNTQLRIALYIDFLRKNRYRVEAIGVTHSMLTWAIPCIAKPYMNAVYLCLFGDLFQFSWPAAALELRVRCAVQRVHHARIRRRPV